MKKLISILVISISILFVWSCERSNLPSGTIATWRGGEINQDFFDQSIESLPLSGQAKLQDSVRRHQYFDRLLEKALVAHHMESHASSHELAKFNFQSEMTLAQRYQEYLLVENAGFTTSKLLMHFEKNKSRFLSDSSFKSAPQGQDIFEMNRKRVARDLALQTYDFKRFYESNKKKLVAPPESVLEWIWTRDKDLKLDSIQAGIENSVITWDDALIQEYSQDTLSKGRQGSLGKVTPMSRDKRLKPFMAQLRSRLFRQKRWKGGEVFTIEVPGQQALFYLRSFTPAKQRAYEDSKELMYAKMGPDLQIRNHKALIDSLKTKFKVGTLNQNSEDLRGQALKEYQSYPERYHSQESHFLSYALISKNQDTSSFSQLGWIKATHSLPLGLGVVKGLDHFLKNNQTGKLSSPFNTVAGEVIFRLDSTLEGSLKPFDRVQKSIEVALSQGKLERQPDSLVIAWSKQDRRLLTGQEVNFFIERMNPKALKRYSKKDIIQHLIGLKIYSQEAQNHGFVLRPEVITQLKTFRRNYWYDYYKGKGKYLMMNLDSLALQKIHQKYPLVVGQKSVKQSLSELALLSKMDWNLIEAAFESDSLSRAQTFNEMRFLLIKNLELEQLGEMARGSQLKIHKPQWKKNWPLDSVDIWSDVDSLSTHDLIKLQRIVAWNPHHAEVDTISYLLAQQLQENRKYKSALLVFQAILEQFPNSSVAHRAAFLKAYVFYEYLKKDREAMAAFEFMLSNYPNNELSDDAEVLLKDLKSGRKHLKNIMNNLGKRKATDKKTIKQGESSDI